MRLPLQRRRAAQIAHGFDERRRVGRFHHDRVGVIGQRRRAIERHRLHERLAEGLVAARAERRVELGRPAPRRDPEQRRQRLLRVDVLAIGDLALERQRRAEMRVHAAPALRDAGRKPQQPAVVEELALRLQHVEPGLLDADEIERHRSRIAAHASADEPLPIASTTSV